MSAESGAWLRRQREGRGWSRQDLAIRIAGAAGSAVTAPVPALESYISRWEAGNVQISARYRQLLDTVLGPSAEVPGPQPPSGPAPDPRKWVQAMHALACDITGGTFRPGGQLPARAVLAQRYGLTVHAVMRAQDELLRAAVLTRGQIYGRLYVSQATGRQVSATPLRPPAVPGPADPGRGTAVILPGRAGRGAGGTAPPAARHPRAYARPDARPPAVRAGAGHSEKPSCSPSATGEPSPADGLPEFLLVKECAAQARVSPRTIHSLVRDGHIEATRVGRDIRIYARSWHAYLQTPAQDLRSAPEPDPDGQRDSPPAVRTSPAGSRPGPTRSSHGSAAGRVPRSQMNGRPPPDPRYP